MNETEVNDTLNCIKEVDEYTLIIKKYVSKILKGQKVPIITYSVLIAVAGLANIAVLIWIKMRKRKSMMDIMIINLSVADLITSFSMIPIQYNWSSYNPWRWGEVVCRGVSFFQMFGIYLSSFVLICLSIDRYIAVLKPLLLAQNKRKRLYMLITAWVAAFICSIPEIALNGITEGVGLTLIPLRRCKQFKFFTKTGTIIYIVFMAIVVFPLPLIISIYCYFCILRKLYQNHREWNDGKNISKRKIAEDYGRTVLRTLKMSITIITCYTLCWTPYYIFYFWVNYDNVSYWKHIDVATVKKDYFMLANAIMNPILYFDFNLRKSKQESIAESREQLMTAEQFAKSREKGSKCNPL